MTLPKRCIADHWTWRDGKPHVTGWHTKPARVGARESEAETSAVGPTRGLVATAQGSLL